MQQYFKTILSLLLSAYALSGVQAQTVKWGHTFGSPKNLSSNSIQYFHNLEFYSEDILYASGRYNDTLLADGIYFSDHNQGLWLSKLDTNGHIHWIKAIGKRLSSNSSPLTMEIYTIKADTAHEALYVCGMLNPGTYAMGNDTISVGSTYSEMFVAKLDTAGNPIWARASSRSGSVPLNLISIDDLDVLPDGGILLTGTHSGVRNWLGETLTVGDRRSGFVSRLDANGNKLWTKPIVSNSYDTFGKSVVVATDSTALVTGVYRGTISFGGFTASSPSGVGAYNFLAEMDLNGNVNWLKTLGNNPLVSQVQNSKLKKFGNHIYANFVCLGSFAIPDINQLYNASSTVGGSEVILRLGLDGTINKNYPLPTAVRTADASIYADSSGSDLYVAVNFWANYNWGGISFQSDCNLVHFDSSGSIVSNVALLNGVSSMDPNISGNNHGQLVIGGQLAISRNFGQITLDNYGTKQAFLLAVDANFAGKISIPQSNGYLCPRDSFLLVGPPGYQGYLWSNGTKNDSTYVKDLGLYSLSLVDSNGLSYVSQRISVNPINSSIPPNIQGDSILCSHTDSLLLQANPAWVNVVWNNGLQNGYDLHAKQAGMYYFTAQDTSTSCTFYSDTLWIRNSSTDTLGLHIPLDSICIGQSTPFNFSISAAIDSSSLELFQGSTGWLSLTDSTLHFNIAGSDSIRLAAINEDGCTRYSPWYSIVVIDTPSVQISFVGDTLFSNYPDGNQWYMNGSLLAQDTLHYLIINQNGQYGLKVVNAFGCSDSSSIQISNFALPDASMGLFAVYPNPFQKQVVLELNPAVALPFKLQLYDAQGTAVKTISVETHLHVLHLQDLPPGLYFLQQGAAYLKLIKQ